MKIRGGPSPKKKQQAESEDGKVVITADNPVSCLYEYAKKVLEDSKQTFLNLFSYEITEK